MDAARDEAAADFHTEGSVEHSMSSTLAVSQRVILLVTLRLFIAPHFIQRFYYFGERCAGSVRLSLTRLLWNATQEFLSLSLFALKEHFLKMPFFPPQIGSPNIPLHFFLFFFPKNNAENNERNKQMSCMCFSFFGGELQVQELSSGKYQFARGKNYVAHILTEK